MGIELLESIRLGSGGNPALATYALEGLWSAADPTPATVMDLYERFQRKHHDFLRSALRSFTAEALSGAPARVLDLVRRSGGLVERKRLLQVLDPQPGTELELEDVFDLLESAGLIRMEGARAGDPVRVRPVASLLNSALAHGLSCVEAELPAAQHCPPH